MNLELLVTKQLDQLFGCLPGPEFLSLVQRAEERAKHCVFNVIAKGGGEFRPTHTGQYLIFLYYLSRAAFESGMIDIAERVYALNKALHAVDIYPAVKLPDVFFCEHPVGSVLGRADYGARFFFMQNCTVGGSRGDAQKRIYPVIGDAVSLCAYSAVIGQCSVGNRVVLSAGARVINQDVPNDVVVFGRSPHLIFKPLSDSTRDYFEYFRQE